MPVPTPADLAARLARRPPLLAGSHRKFRSRYLQAMRETRMIPHTKLVGLVLGVYGTPDGVIPANRQPGVAGLATATGLTPGMVLVQLGALEQRQWLQRVPGARYDTEPLRLSIPDAVARSHGWR
ncbi:hypothetical protein [Streptomyces erythrochromogenes]|uniref:hypothetical protein n=1 Tax=Streptomyces erythrochromogenes TaxID=285574 RepID=UPI0036AAC066